MKKLTTLLAVGLLSLASVSSYADYDRSREPKAPKPGGDNGKSNKREASIDNFGCNTMYNSTAELNINNVRALILLSGDMWWDRNIARYEVPKITDVTQIRRTSLFAGAIWIAGRDSLSKELLVTAQTYSNPNSRRSYWPGPLDELSAATSKSRCDAWDQHFPCLKTTVLQYLSDFNQGLITSPTQIPEEILYWPGRLNPYLPTKPSKPIQAQDLDFNLARFNDVDGDGIYNPLQGDYPQLPGDDGASQRDVINSADQTFFFVLNDRGLDKRFDGATTAGIGMEVQTEAFAYVTSDPRNDMTFYRNKLVNKGNRIIKDCYFGQWVDPDLGYSADDYVGCDVPRGLGICYNGSDIDPTLFGYGANPPSVAVDFFIGPEADPGDGIDNNKDGTIDEPNEKIILSDFMYYNIGQDAVNGDPESPSDYYNYLRMIWRNGQRVSYDLKVGRTPVGQGNIPGTNIPVPPCVFIFPDNTDQTICWGSGGTVARPCPQGPLPTWNERTANNPPGDRRFLGSAGPFTLMPGAVNQLTIGVVWARASAGGATGSFNKLLLADDLAQRLFDRNFKILLGPQEPKVRVTELDREIILTIIPDTFQGVGTEDYAIRDNSLNPLNGSQDYRFEGYKVYQLADDKVSTGELDDPNRAVLIAQSDIRNGVGRIINREFDPVTSEVIPVVKVEGADQGIRNVVRVRTDAFTQGNLINQQRYFFRVITYAYNGNTQNQEPFLQGFPIPSRGTGTVFGIPHKKENTFGGLEINSSFDQTFTVRRLTGVGSGNKRMPILGAADENNIVTAPDQNTVKPYTLEGLGAPVQIKVFDPTLVQNADFRVELSSRLRFRPNGNTTYQIGDTIVSNLNNERIRIAPENTPRGTNDIVAPSEVSKTVTQIPAEAVINRILPVPGTNLVDLDVTFLNDDRGGRFSWMCDIFRPNPADRNAPSYFEEYREFYRTFRLKRTPYVVPDSGQPSIFDVPILVSNYDFWKLTVRKSDGTSSEYRNRKLISESEEQLVPDYGISIGIVNVNNPLFQIRANRGNGYLASAITFKDPAKPWLSGIQSRGSNVWTMAELGEGDQGVASLDPARQYLNMLNRTWIPYPLAQSSTASTIGPIPLVRAPEVEANMRALRNVDVVFTPDRSKWTRCIVLMAHNDTVPGLNGRPLFRQNRYLKSKTPSVDQNFQSTGALSPYTRGGTTYPSRGMSWFPGYAIDLDRGVRLNMAFSESAVLQRARGVDLVYEFPITEGSGNLANQNWVYVFDDIYDEARRLETSLDSIDYNFGYSPRHADLNSAVARSFWSRCMYIGYPGVRETAIPANLRDPSGMRVSNALYSNTRLPFSNEARVSVRINRAFAYYGGAPTYTFSTDGLAVKTNVKSTAQSALDLIRVAPNPYYAYSSYEVSQTDNRVKIINLPSRADVSIFTLNGTLIRTFSVDFRNVQGQSSVNTIDWDLTSATGLPIASGSYLIHVDAKELGSRTVKFFCVTRPLDVEGINQSN